MTDSQKGKLIRKGLQSAKCRYCKRPGITQLCDCSTHLTLIERNWHGMTGSAAFGPIGKLP